MLNSSENFPQKPELKFPEKMEREDLLEKIKSVKLFTELINKFFEVDESFFKEKREKGITFEELKLSIRNFENVFLSKCEKLYPKRVKIAEKGMLIVEEKLFCRIRGLSVNEKGTILSKRYFLYLFKQFVLGGEKIKSFEKWEKEDCINPIEESIEEPPNTVKGLRT